MKKMILALALVFTISGAFASDVTVTKEVLKSFNNNFSNATDITWTIGDGYYKAAFTLNEQKVFAFFNSEGEYLGLARYINTLQLPVYQHSSLKKHYGQKWVTDLFEMANDEGTTYYITLEDANTKLVLKSTPGSDWYVYKKIEKM